MAGVWKSRGSGSASVDAWKPPDQYFTGACGSNRRQFIASGHGLGRMVIYAGTILDTTLVWVGVIVLSLLAMVMYFAVVELEKWMTEHLAIYRKA